MAKRRGSKSLSLHDSFSFADYVLCQELLKEKRERIEKEALKDLHVDMEADLDTTDTAEFSFNNSSYANDSTDSGQDVVDKDILEESSKVKPTCGPESDNGVEKEVQFSRPGKGNTKTEKAEAVANEAKSEKEIFTWKEPQALLLIDLYQANQFKLSDSNYKKKHVWQAITDEIHKEGFFPTPAQGEGRWRTITSNFKKTIDHNTISGNGRKECLYFTQLSEIYGCRQNVVPVATASSTGKEDTTRDPSKHATRNQVDSGECETVCAEDIQTTDHEQDDIEAPNKDELNESMDIKKSERKKGGRENTLQLLQLQHNRLSIGLNHMKQSNKSKKIKE